MRAKTICVEASQAHTLRASSTPAPSHSQQSPWPALRALLLGIVAATMLLIIAPHTAHAGPDACTTVGTTVTCTGDQSDGIAISAPELIVENITSDIIRTGDGNDGIRVYHSGGTVTLNSSTGNFGISVTGESAEGVVAYTTGGGIVNLTHAGDVTTNGREAQGVYGLVNTSGNVTIHSTGDIITLDRQSQGVIGQVLVNGNVDVTSIGNITAGSTGSHDSDGVRGLVRGNGNVIVNSTGEILTKGSTSRGVFSEVRGSGNATVTSNGNVSTEGATSYGILAQIYVDGDATITSTGDVSTEGSNAVGIYGDIDGNGDLEIDSTGDVSTTGSDSHGIYGDVDGTGNITITSEGDVSTADDSSHGIYGDVASGNMSITSTGGISITGADSYGLFGIVNGDGNATINSTGDISTTAHGIYGDVNGNGDITITSKGDVATTQASAHAIYGDIDGNGDLEITSTGAISTTGSSSYGIFADLAGNGALSITNTGNITSTQAAGIYVNADGTGSVAITHSGGTISGTTGISIAARTLNAPATLNLSGPVTGTNGTAINLAGDGNDVVYLRPGAVITGTMDFGNGNDGLGGTNADDIDTLTALAGYNGEIHFADAGGAGQGDTDLQSAPEIINGSHVRINNGTAVLFVDMSLGLEANAVLLDEVVTSIFGVVDMQNAGTGGAPDPVGSDQALGYAPQAKPDTLEAFAAFDAFRPSYRLWGSGFGNWKQQKGTATTLAATLGHAGAIMGAEVAPQADLAAGFYLGQAGSRVDIGSNSMDMDTASTFAGVYARHTWRQNWLNVTLLGGFSKHDDVRYVGAQPAHADYNSLFIAPAVTVGSRVSGILPDHDLIPSFRVGYTGQFIDGYTETGVDQPLSVNARSVHLVSGRTQIAVPHTWTYNDGATLKVEGNMGVSGIASIGASTVQTSIAGTALDFAAMSTNVTASGFAGLAFKQTSADGRSAISTLAEGHFDTVGSWAARGELSISARF